MLSFLSGFAYGTNFQILSLLGQYYEDMRVDGNITMKSERSCWISTEQEKADLSNFFFSYGYMKKNPSHETEWFPFSSFSRNIQKATIYI